MSLCVRRKDESTTKRRIIEVGEEKRGTSLEGKTRLSSPGGGRKGRFMDRM